MNLCETCSNAAHIIEAYWDGIIPSSVEQRVKHQCTLVRHCLEAVECPYYYEKLTKENNNEN